MNTIGQKTILLVEDEAIIGMAQSMQLKQYGYDVIHVRNGQKALDAFSNDDISIDLVLMDINLGSKMDGTETAKEITSRFGIPVLFLSSYIDQEIVNKTANITSYGYVVKNSGITVLDASIKMAFRLHESKKNLTSQKMATEEKQDELQVMEKRYRRLFESAKDGILILNAENGKIVDVNPYLIDLLGYSKEQFLDRNIWDISAFKNIDYSKHLYKELQEKDYVRYDDLPLETSSGNLISVEFVSNVYLVDGVRVIQCNIRDISHRKVYENRLANDIDEKSALLTEIQHRTKNSFALITSLLILRSIAATNEDTKSTLEEMAIRVKSISDLYTMLYETNSYYDVQLKTYCNKVIDSMLCLSDNVIINRNIEDITVSTKHAASIGMILVELLSNAVKYAFPGPHRGVIDVGVNKINSKIVLTVEDNGIGIEKHLIGTNNKTLGLHLVDLMVGQLNGSSRFITDNGTKCIIEFDPILLRLS